MGGLLHQVAAEASLLDAWQEVRESDLEDGVPSQQLLDYERGVLGKLHDLLARLAQHEQVAASFQREVIPLARTAVAAAINAYQVDQVDFMTLLGAQEKLDNYETEYWNNQAERFRDLAEIDEVAGAVLVEDGWNK